VVYGNIGAPDRLDFTVIGTAVNVVTRIAGLCAQLNQELLLSKAFAGHAGAPLISLGAHALKGIADPEEFSP
jgi:adenylate cyclase